MHKILEPNNSQRNMHEYRNAKLEGYEIDLYVADAVHVFQNCEFNNCLIRVNSDSNVTPNILLGNSWNNCIFSPRKELSLSTIEADFIGCKFEGKWSGRIMGKVQNCDFSDADLVFFIFHSIKTLGGNTVSEMNSVVVESAGDHRRELKERLSGKSNMTLHLRPDVGVLVFNIERQKNPELVLEAIQDLPYVQVPQ